MENDVSWDADALQTWAVDLVRSARAQARRLFLYLTGENAASTSPRNPFHTGSEPGSNPLHSSHRDTQIGRSESDGGLWSGLTGLFSGIGRSASGGRSSGSSRKDEWRELYEEGEVHCDLIKVRLSVYFL